MKLLTGFINIMATLVRKRFTVFSKLTPLHCILFISFQAIFALKHYITLLEVLYSHTYVVAKFYSFE